MKNLIAIAFLLALFTTAASAQVQVNPKIGFNLYDISDDAGDFKVDGKSGFHLGVDFRIGESIYVQPGIHYYSLNTDFEGLINDDATNVIKDDVRANNIRIPLVLGAKFLNTDVLGLRAQVGGVGMIPFNIKDNDLLIGKDDYKAVNFGATVGAGVDIGRVTLDLNYDFGLTDSFDKDEINFSGKGNVLSLSLGFLF